VKAATPINLEFVVLKEIRKRLANLSPRERAVGEYVLKNPESLAFLSIMDLAKKVGVSQATVVRFSNSLGYDGYSQLRNEVREAIQFKYGAADRFKLGRKIQAQQQKGDDSFFSRVIAAEIDNLISLTENMRATDLHNCVDRAVAADRIAIIGSLSSSSLATHMYNMMGKILPEVDLILVRDIWALTRIRNYGKRSVVFLISFPRFPKDSQELASLAKKQGAYIVVITNSPLSPPVQIADQTFFVNVDVPSYVDGYAAPLAFINALVTEIGMKNPDASQRGLNFYDQYVSHLDLFVKKNGEWRFSSPEKQKSSRMSQNIERKK
jgi:DNA-binding MurR/RpiR family transcriptional regulator